MQIGTVHIDDNVQPSFDTQRVNLFFQVGGDLVDLVSLADTDYQMDYAVPVEVHNNLQATLVVQTPNKVKQVVYGKLSGTLNSLLAMSNNQVAKFFVELDVKRTGSDPEF